MNKHQKSKRIILALVIILFLVAFLVSLTNNNVVQAIDSEPDYKPIDRFGITIPYNTGDYVGLVNQINAKAVIDWGSDDNNEWGDGIDYIHVIRVSDAAYNNGVFLGSIENLVKNNQGEVWIIGNEPDRFYYQDSVTAEVYAQRYYQIALRIRHFDPTAQIGFGSVVQPTPIRIRYLERAINQLTYLSCGNRQAALDLIDIWSIHAFILNEHPDQWGAGIPVGFENDWFDAIQISDFSDTHSIDIFSQRINYFRSWMNSLGEKNKPLWITEYGSLFPPIDPPGVNYENVSDDLTADFMVDTFEFMMTNNDPLTGFSVDGNRLVQRWFWYSLNEYRFIYGGSLFDPNDNYKQTIVGQAFESYTTEIVTNPPIGDNPVLYRQTQPVYEVHYDESSDTLSYPYAICHLTHLPLVIK